MDSAVWQMRSSKIARDARMTFAPVERCIIGSDRATMHPRYARDWKPSGKRAFAVATIRSSTAGVNRVGRA